RARTHEQRQERSNDGAHADLHFVAGDITTAPARSSITRTRSAVYEGCTRGVGSVTIARAWVARTMIVRWTRTRRRWRPPSRRRARRSRRRGLRHRDRRRARAARPRRRRRPRRVSPDGAWLATAGDDRTIRVWAARDARVVVHDAGAGGKLALSPRGDRLAWI